MTVKFVILLIAFYLLYKLFRKGSAKVGGSDGHGRFQKSATGEELVEDPVCHTYIPISNAIKWETKGKTVYFCSQKCLEKYKSEQE
jgi:YHS domain-containing protein